MKKTGKYKDVNWALLETEFVTDTSNKPCTLKELAEQHQISYSRLRGYAAGHNWTDKRNNYATELVQKTTEKATEAVSNQAATALARHFKISSDLLTVIEKSVANADDLAMNDSRLMNMVNALDKLQKMQRQTLGLMDKKDEESLAIARQKVEPEPLEEYEDDGFMDALDGAARRVWAVDEDDNDETVG